MATNSDGRAERDGAVVGRSSGLSQGQNLVAKDCCGLMSHWGQRGKVSKYRGYITGSTTHTCISLTTSCSSASARNFRSCLLITLLKSTNKTVNNSWVRMGLCILRNVPPELPELYVSGLKHIYTLRMKLILYV